MNNYEDIINLPNPNPKNHQRMSIEARCAQFMPFSALTGYSELVKEKARLTEDKIEIDDSLKLIISDKLNMISDNIKEKKDVSVIIRYFLKDLKKDGGKYIEKECLIKRIDFDNKVIILKDKEKIKIEDIIDIKGDLFQINEDDL